MAIKNGGGPRSEALQGGCRLGAGGRRVRAGFGPAICWHVSGQHLKRYLAEFDWRYNHRTALGVSDAERMEKSISGIVGKRLTYRRTDRKGAPVRA